MLYLFSKKKIICTKTQTEQDNNSIKSSGERNKNGLCWLFGYICEKWQRFCFWIFLFVLLFCYSGKIQ